MNCRKLSLTCLSLLFLSVAANCQLKKYLYYFDNNMHAATESNSTFFGIGLKDNGIVELKCFNKTNKHLVFTAHYTDSTLTLMEGLFQSYHNNGYQENEGNFLKGKEDGLWQKWDSLGNIIDSSIYQSGIKIFWGIFNYYPNGILSSAVFYDLQDARSDKAIYYDEKGNIISPETLDKDTDKIFIRAEIEATFPGGEGAWTRFITKQLTANIDDLHEDFKSRGTCHVKFIVNKEGKVSNVEALDKRDSKLAKVVVKAITNGPPWLPAMQNGRRVKAYRIQPVTFTVVGD